MAFLTPFGRPPECRLTGPFRPKIATVRSVFPFVHDFTEALRQHRLYMALALSNPNVRHVRQPLDLRREDGIGLFFAMPNAPRGLTFDKLKDLRGAGVQFMALADGGQTEYGDGFRGTGSLTKRGKLLIEWMCESGITLDLSHASHATARAAIDFIGARNLPMRPVATHSGCHAVYRHPRNYPDDILRAIVVELGGYVGIHAVSFWLSPHQDAALDRFAEHVAHAIAVCGGTSVGIGSHCVHQDMSIADAKDHFFRMVPVLQLDETIGERFPDRSVELIRSGSRAFKIFEHTLGQRQISKDVLGRNFRIFMENTLTASR